MRVTDGAMVDRAVLNKAVWAAGIADSWSPHLYVFAGDPRDGGRLHARFFAPGFGIEEDPATGSACASLVASLAQRSPDLDGSYEVQIDQGVVMDRPSSLEGTAYQENGRLTEIVVSGRATIIGRGTMALPTE
ncbi:MAG: PhzF family phenazine biosynthesis protein [Mycobacterium sp.]|nr:PhzF family phenazine biosynthesis protein [Mycobacterium sp.]